VVVCARVYGVWCVCVVCVCGVWVCGCVGVYVSVRMFCNVYNIICIQ